MKTISPHRAPAPESVIHGARQADGEAPHPRGQALAVVGFEEEVHVVVLNGELEEAEARM